MRKVRQISDLERAEVLCDDVASWKFERGDAVRASDEGVARNILPDGAVGVVIGFGHKPTTVRVRRQGLKTVVAYHMDFWEVQK